MESQDASRTTYFPLSLLPFSDIYLFIIYPLISVRKSHKLLFINYVYCGDINKIT